jgi:hypothetical protein
MTFVLAIAAAAAANVTAGQSPEPGQAVKRSLWEGLYSQS